MKSRTISLAFALLFSFSTFGPSLAFHPMPIDASVEALAPQGPDAIAGCPMFPPDNVWNTRVDSLPIDARSSAYINSIGPTTGLHPDFGTVWAGAPNGIPYTTVLGTQPFVTVTFGYDDESDPGPYPIPPDAPIEGGPNSSGDRHVLVVENTNCKLYEMYSAYPEADGSWTAGSGAIFDLRSNILRPDTWTSADAAGLPILPGLVRYDEVASGVITHALRFTAQRTQRKYIWPARHYASSITDPNVPPMGQRFRLKASFDISSYPAQVQVILTAFKTYGIILADNGSNWFINGAPDPRWDDDMLSQLSSVKGSNFEAVDESGLMRDPNSGVALGSVTDLRVTNAVTGAGMLTATLRWTSPINALTTTMRYSGVSIADANWTSATVISNDLAGSATVLTAVVPYSNVVYFALKSQSATGTWSALSNNAFWPHWDIYLPVVLR
jgi:hypothetical protein